MKVAARSGEETSMKRLITACLLTTACGTAVVGEDLPADPIPNTTRTVKIWARPDAWVAAHVEGQPWRRLTTTFADHFELTGVTDRYAVMIGADNPLVFDATVAELPEIIVGYARITELAQFSVDVVGLGPSSSVAVSVGGAAFQERLSAPFTFDLSAPKGIVDLIAIERDASDMLGLKIERDITLDADRRATVDLGTDAIRPARATASLAGVAVGRSTAELITSNGRASVVGPRSTAAMDWHTLPPGLARRGDLYALRANDDEVSITRFLDATTSVAAQALDVTSIPRLPGGVSASRPARLTGLTFASNMPTIGYVVHFLMPGGSNYGINLTVTPGAIDGGAIELELPTALEGFDPLWIFPSGQPIITTIRAIAANRAKMGTYFMTQEGELQTSEWQGTFTAP